MEYKEYFSVIMEQLRAQVGEDSLRFYAKGYRPANKDEKEFVKDTNRRYFNSATGVCLLGDTITVALPQKSSSIESTVRVMPSLNFEEGTPIEKVLKKLRGDIDALLSNEDYTENIELRGAYDYDIVKDQLILRPLNYYRHVNDLQDAVYEREGDIAVVLYQLVKDSAPNLLTSKIKRVEIEKWGKLDELETVFRDAMENTMRLFPAVVCDAKAEEEINFLETDIASAEEISMSNGCILLSTSRTTNGAIAIFYPGVRDKLHKLLGESFFVVFMNINDVMIVPRSDSSKARAFLASAKRDGEMGEMLSQTLFLSDKRGLNPKK